MHKMKLLWILSVFILSETVHCASLENPKYECSLSTNLKKEIASYKPIVDKIIRTVTEGKFKGKTYNELATFVDKFGNRIAGSNNLENAIDYMLEKMEKMGLEDVHGEPVVVPHWVRGNEEATLLQPRVTKMAMLGLGSSIGTPPEGITAEAVVVESFDELKSMEASKINGKIVVFAESWVSYGTTVAYRKFASVEAAKLGGRASLVQSITPFSMDTPHTGWQDYDSNVKQIPVACITLEDAQMLLRMYRRGEKVVINLKMEAKNLKPTLSRNSVSEIKGRKTPEEVVLVSGHLDSWDVGNGAMDDGGGAFISWYSLVVLQELGLRPRRTIRSVLWTAEEEGLVGAFAYKDAHKNETFNLLMESDEGTFTPYGLEFSGSDNASCIMEEMLKLLAPINATQLVRSSDVGSDIQVWAKSGIPLASLANKNENYFWFHHSNADRMAIEDSDTLDKCVAVWATAAYISADLSVNLPQ